MKNITSLMTSAVMFLNLCGFNSQTNNPAPYCASAFQNNYNMVSNVSLGGTNFVVGPAGSFSNTNAYVYYNNAQFPSISINGTSTLSIGFYSAQDTEPIYFGVWIDFNNNNSFDPTELLMNNTTTSNQPLPTFTQNSVTLTKSFTVPATAQAGVSRMRVVRGSHLTSPFSAYSSTYTPNPCNTTVIYAYGCTYDFSVNITAPVAPKPIVQFSANVTSVTVNGTVALTDQSANSPTSWNWSISPAGFTFTNSTNASSQNPKVKFTSVGTYTVKLKATNAGGSDSLTKVSYIKVNSNVFLPEEKASGNWMVYPNPTGNYLHFYSANGSERFKVSLIDLMGRIVREFEPGSTQADISELQNGVYILSAESLNGETLYRQRIMKH